MLMPGATLILSQRGEQDRLLNIRPDFSLFKTEYRKHTGFATQTQELFFNSTEFGNRSVCNLLKDADLVTGIKLKITLPTLNIKSLIKTTTCTKDVDITCFCNKCNVSNVDTIFGWANSIGHIMCEEYSFNIGSKEINKNTGEWLEWWSELAQTAEKKPGYWEMIGKKEPATFKPSTFSDEMELYIPLDFFFTGKLGHAFPIAAVANDNITVDIKWRDFADCWICNKEGVEPGFIPKFKASLLVDYVFLDNKEHNKFINDNHMYLIEQVHRNCPTQFSYTTSLPVIDLNYTQPTKSIYWAVRRRDINIRSTTTDPDFTYGNDWYNYSCYKTRYRNIFKDPIKTASLTLNGETVLEPFSAKYHRLVQAYDHHTKTPNNYIYMHCFAQSPEENQPTGTCNMSMFHKIKLKLEMCENYPTDYDVISYSLAYNFLIIKDRKASLGYMI